MFGGEVEKQSGERSRNIKRRKTKENQKIKKEKLKNRDHLYIIYIKKRHDSILIIPERNWTLAISDLHPWNVYVALNGKGKKKRRTIFFLRREW